ncbi:hypothetical protein HK099_001092, partial [Clydaea vesicula]
MSEGVHQQQGTLNNINSNSMDSQLQSNNYLQLNNGYPQNSNNHQQNLPFQHQNSSFNHPISYPSRSLTQSPAQRNQPTIYPNYSPNNNQHNPQLTLSTSTRPHQPSYFNVTNIDIPSRYHSPSLASPNGSECVQAGSFPHNQFNSPLSPIDNSYQYSPVLSRHSFPFQNGNGFSSHPQLNQNSSANFQLTQVQGFQTNNNPSLTQSNNFQNSNSSQLNHSSQFHSNNSQLNPSKNFQRYSSPLNLNNIQTDTAHWNHRIIQNSHLNSDPQILQNSNHSNLNEQSAFSLDSQSQQHISQQNQIPQQQQHIISRTPTPQMPFINQLDIPSLPIPTEDILKPRVSKISPLTEFYPALPVSNFPTPPISPNADPALSERFPSPAPSQMSIDREVSKSPAVVKKRNVGKKVHACEYPGCESVFTRSYNLKSHILCHTLERPHSCEFCTNSFGRKHDLQRHIRKIHKINPPKCPKCNQMFAGNKSLKKHLFEEERLHEWEYEHFSQLFPENTLE